MNKRWNDEDELESVAAREVVHVYVEYSTEDEEYGPVYIASCLELDVVVYGKTLDDLLTALREGIAAHLENVDTVAQYRLVPHPRIMMMLTVDL